MRERVDVEDFVDPRLVAWNNFSAAIEEEFWCWVTCNFATQQEQAQESLLVRCTMYDPMMDDDADR